MGDPSLAQLRAFVLAARKGSLSAAAIELNLTPSAVSYGLKGLERHLGLQVLERHGRGVRPSAAGLALLPLAEGLLGQLDALRGAAAASSTVTGTVRLAAFPSLARHLLPEALVTLQRTHPTLTLALDDAHLDRRAVIEAVQSGQADIGLTQLLPGTTLRAHVLGDDPYELIAPVGWMIPEVWTRPYLHLGDPRDLQVPRALARHGVAVKPSLSLSSESALVAMVARGLGFTLLPRMTVPPLPAGVTRHALPWPVSRTYGIIRRPGPPSPAAQAVLNVLQRFLTDEISPIGQGGRGEAHRR